MVEASTLTSRIESALPDSRVAELEDLTGGGDHYRAVVVWAGFAGKSRIQQHQAVYAALGELMSGPVHALALQTLTPEQWSERQSKPA